MSSNVVMALALYQKTCGHCLEVVLAGLLLSRICDILSFQLLYPAGALPDAFACACLAGLLGAFEKEHDVVCLLW